MLSCPTSFLFLVLFWSRFNFFNCKVSWFNATRSFNDAENTTRAFKNIYFEKLYRLHSFMIFKSLIRKEASLLYPLTRVRDAWLYDDLLFRCEKIMAKSQVYSSQINFWKENCETCKITKDSIAFPTSFQTLTHAYV